MSHLLWLVPCLFKEQFLFLGMATGSFLIYLETYYPNNQYLRFVFLFTSITFSLRMLLNSQILENARR